MNRRHFLHTGLAATASLTIIPTPRANPRTTPRLKLIDTHQHLWDLNRFQPPWLRDAPKILSQSYVTKDYKQATSEFDVRAVYMEVDVAVNDHTREAEHVIALSKDKNHPTEAAVISGRPNSKKFHDYISQFKGNPYIRGVRQVLHVESAQPKLCLKQQFVASMKLLGTLGMSFDLCMRPADLGDGYQLARQCPETTFIVDHCGNADPKAFGKISPRQEEPTHKADQWKSEMATLATQPNCICKISGIVARAPKGWTPDHLAPIVNFCLDEFGPDRVVFGSDWPVCLLGAKLPEWIHALHSIVSSRSPEEQEKLFFQNAQRIYRLN